MADVLIKNIPLSFLKDKPDSFLKSEALKGAVALFDKYKKPVTDDSELKNPNILPMELMLTLLSNKYKDIDTVLPTSTNVEDAILIGLIGKDIPNNKLNFKPRKYITKTIKDIKHIPFFNSNSIDSNHLYYSLEDTKRPENLNNLSTYSDRKPDPTNNVIKDIVATSKFYDSILHPDVYDDKAYEDLLLAKRNKANYIATKVHRLFQPISMKEAIDVYNQNEIEESLKILRLHLLTKYNDSYTLYAYKNKNVHLYDTTTTISNLSYLLHNRKDDYPLNISLQTFLNTNTIEINSNGLDSSMIRIYNINGKDVSNSIIQSITTGENKHIVTLKSASSGTVLCLYTRYPDMRIECLRDYYVAYLDTKYNDYISAFNATVSNDKDIKLHVRNFDNGYLFAVIYDLEGNRLDSSKYTLDVTNKMIRFSGLKEGMQYIVYILPTHKILANIGTVKVNIDNIYEYLATHFPYDKEIRTWIEND